MERLRRLLDTHPREEPAFDDAALALVERSQPLERGVHRQHVLAYRLLERGLSP